MIAMSNYREAVRSARRLARTQGDALLSTLSAEMDGWPFGSVAPYVLDHQGAPVLLLSDLAQHSRNLARDDRISLLTWDREQPDIQQGGRITLLGRVHVTTPDAALRARYLRYLPQSEQYFSVHDFRFYRLDVERVRFIGGFGEIHWIRGADYLLDASLCDPALAEAEAGAVVHMNEDHAPALRALCLAQGVEESDPRLLGIDPEGCDIRTRAGRVRVDFPEPVTTAAALRPTFVRLTQALGGRGQDLPGARPA